MNLLKRKPTLVVIVVCIMLFVCVVYHLVTKGDDRPNFQHHHLKNWTEQMKDNSASSASVPDTSRVTQTYFNSKYNISKLLYVNSKQRGKPSDPRVFNYIRNEPHACTGNVALLVYIHSSVGNHARRDAIRTTWANPHTKHNTEMVVVFFLGISNSLTDMEKVKTESLSQHDIIQEDFIDSYRNLSLKVGSTLKWITHYCSHARMVLKLDDDVLINTFTIQRFIDTALRTEYINTEKFMICMIIQAPKPSRGRGSKWFVSRERYPPSKYPAYCPGNLIFISPAAVTALYDAIFVTKFFWIDDVYISGMLRQRAGVEIVSIQDISAKARVEFKPMMSDQTIRETVFIAFHYEGLKAEGISLMSKVWKRLTSLFPKGH